MQLRLGPLRFQPEDHPVVEVLQVIDPVSVHDQRVGQRAELKQPQKIGVVARQAGDLKPEDRADLALAHPADQLLVAVAAVGVATGDAEIAVDGQDPSGLPAQLGGAVGERVLALGRAHVLAHLSGR